jgi:hypothetical protein
MSETQAFALTVNGNGQLEPSDGFLDFLRAKAAGSQLTMTVRSRSGSLGYTADIVVTHPKEAGRKDAASGKPPKQLSRWS